MQTVDAVAPARAALAGAARPIGLVPTMGALHDGHLALVRAARASCGTVVASVFVNPLQFGPAEDLERYPRDPEGDRAKLEAAGVDLLFAPPREALYPAGFNTTVDPGGVGDCFEGAMRPGHFRGVATVVLKLINVLRPDGLYLGQKDAQQTAVIRSALRDLDLDVSVHVVPTVRESDGLAMSSRNVYLSPAERAAAPSLHHALCAMLSGLERGDPKQTALHAARGALDPSARLDYLDVVDADTFEPLQHLRPSAFVIGAARFSHVRLIDNIWLPA